VLVLDRVPAFHFSFQLLQKYGGKGHIPGLLPLCQCPRFKLRVTHQNYTQKEVKGILKLSDASISYLKTYNIKM
jgi:hypothetical protein